MTKKYLHTVAALVIMSALAVSAPACAATPITVTFRNKLPPSTISADELKKIEDEVRDEMKDPSSVQFKNVAGYKNVSDDGTVFFLCGELNSKNSYGGYVGYKSFWYWSTPTMPGIISFDVGYDEDMYEEVRELKRTQFNKNWNTNCK